MVLLTRKNISRVPSRSRISAIKFHNFTDRKRQPIVRVVYGTLMIVLSIVLFSIDPLNIIKEYVLDVDEGTFITRLFEKPTFDIRVDVYLFNYTNLEAYLEGRETKIKVEEVGPFAYNEIRTNENVTIDKEKGSMTMYPRTVLEFLPEKSVSHYDDVQMTIPNIAVVAISTFLADTAGYFPNVGLYYIMKGLKSKLVSKVTAGGMMWGYHDPLVAAANKIVPGWIDFAEIGVLDRFYAYKHNELEVEIKNRSRKFSINKWNKVPGIAEQGFTDWNTSTPCNQVRDTYEGIMLRPDMPKGVELKFFRSHACRVYPFLYNGEVDFNGIKSFRYDMDPSAFNKSSKFACKCDDNCLPDGFVNIGNCYYGFPISLTKPHYLDVDPEQVAFYEGLKPDPKKHLSYALYEPTTGCPIMFKLNIQVNIAVRVSPGNPITMPLKGKILPLLWLAMYCEEPPLFILNLLNMQLNVGPVILIVIVSLLNLGGMYLGIQGFYRFFKAENNIILTKDEPTDNYITQNRKCSVVLSIIDKDRHTDDALTKEAAFLLNKTEKEVY